MAVILVVEEVDTFHKAHRTLLDKDADKVRKLGCMAAYTSVAHGGTEHDT